MLNYDINADPGRAELSGALYRLVENALEDISERDDAYSFGPQPEMIEAQSRDGFIPYTNGGWAGTVLANMLYAQGSGCVPKKLQPYLDEAEKVIRKNWLDEHGEEFGYDPESGESAWDFVYRLEQEEDEAREAGTLPGLDAPHVGMRLSDLAEESLREYEDTWLTEGGTYFYKVRAMVFSAHNPRNETGEDEVYILAAINLDFEYGRDSADDILYERTFKLSELTPEVLEQVEWDISNALADA